MSNITKYLSINMANIVLLALLNGSYIAISNDTKLML